MVAEDFATNQPNLNGIGALVASQGYVMAKATKKTGDSDGDIIDPTDNRAVKTDEPTNTEPATTEAKPASAADELEAILKKRQAAETELASIEEGKKRAKQELAELRGEIRTEKAAVLAPQAAVATAPHAQAEPVYEDSTQWWTNHIQQTAQQAVKPITDELTSFKQSSKRKAIKSFLDAHPDVKNADEARFNEIIAIAGRNGLDGAYHPDDIEDILNRSYAFLEGPRILARAKQSEGEQLEAEEALAEAAVSGTASREPSGQTASGATAEDVRVAANIRSQRYPNGMPIKDYLKLKKQAQNEGIMPGAFVAG